MCIRDRLKAAREGRTKRSDQVQTGDVAESAWEELDEDKYKEMVKQRREDNFVEDDGENEDAAGYVDYGEEEDWTRSHYDDEDIPEEGLSGEKKRKSKEQNPTAKRAKAPAKTQVPVSNFFRGGKDPNALSKRQQNVSAVEADDLLQSMLQGIESESGIKIQAPPAQKKAKTQKPPLPKPKKFDPYAYAAPPPKAAAMDLDLEADPLSEKPAENVNSNLSAQEQQELDELKRMQRIAELEKKMAAQAAEQSAPPAEAEPAGMLSPAGGVATNSSTPAHSKTPAGVINPEMEHITPKLHKKVAFDASFWENAEDDDVDAQASPAGSSASAQLPPQNADGSVDFYWFDAVEDAYAFPGTCLLYTSPSPRDS
eukprot:TRINITY_DN60409_c0_g1_i1.p1 TRINITY_DN60409_c0_g1~~TRINITY_DN60409_c0_g1_i1.p1  ORF type:complete len:369 (+),score=135.75 TRINITY_DN60409_c0_g1_i1:135-1241(+)